MSTNFQKKTDCFRTVELWTACGLMYGTELIFTGEIFERTQEQDEALIYCKTLNNRGLYAVADLEKEGKLEEGSLKVAKYYLRNPWVWY